MNVDALDRALINRLQDGLPVCERPYAVVAAELGTDEGELLRRIDALLEAGILTRFGPMYDAARMGGAFTLAAMEVPAARFEEVAAVVNGFVEVAHNYERAHELNMWFVIATERASRIAEVIRAIEDRTGLTVFNFPKRDEYHVGLRFEV